MTWNVLWRFDPDWKGRQERILAVLKEVCPDVLGLQECWATDEHTQAEIFAEHLGMHAAYAASSLPPVPSPPEHPDQNGVRMGVGLVSRWPVLSTRHHALPVSHRQIAPVALEARMEDERGRRFDVLVAGTEWEPEYADDHLAQTRRLAELLAAADDSVPRFLLADLNCDASQAEFAPLAAVADDTWERANGDPRAVTLSSAVPFAPLEATKEIDRRVDHIVARGAGISVTGASTIDSPVRGLFPSDHFPVIADVELRVSSP
ncbi:endonuclease/exonuclease/phosphatase family metal-dependent hydrolase [Okibacterium sp. HSC-33S16]|uniref:endonuclease/exonuclease/phosphatase family protein n=1 Tax=Okibacterium sp. HSC-33S16 TaxID=2910965 RepID=UPI0020A07FF2|nr:endonuclease/exonuclease/phosphatase family protein [Okibacterium sp. HSC-33S16]MCP2032667.1 endonuclease/exonuclease/phosphatase family metal-dependent hydrolase [Okibacterium sp. HSC-33S16]